MFRDEGEQLEQQRITRELECTNRALKPFEKLRPDQTDKLLLAVLFPGVDVFVGTLVVGERVIYRKRKEGLFLEIGRASCRERV